MKILIQWLLLAIVLVILGFDVWVLWCCRDGNMPDGGLGLGLMMCVSGMLCTGLMALISALGGDGKPPKW